MTALASVAAPGVGAATAVRRSVRWNRLADTLIGVLAPLAILLLWSLNSYTAWLPPQVLPTANSVVRAFAEAITSGELFVNIAKTLLWLLGGYAIGATLGLFLGAGMGFSERFADYVGPSFKAISYVPVLGWLPLWLVLLGVGDWLKIVLVAQATLSPVVFNVRDGIRNVPGSLIELGRVTRLSTAQQLRMIILPAAFPSIWAGIRFGLTKAWLALVAVELLASTEGLGFMMVNARALYQLDKMFVSVIAIGLIGFALDRGLEAIERHVLIWRDDEEEVS